MAGQTVVMTPIHRTRNIDIEFKDIVFTVKHGKGTKQVIKGVSGKFKSGELTAIMGPSGAGKTSLLNILTGFQKSGTQGEIKCSGSSHKGDGALQYKKDSCYILQDDHLAPLFTVNEIMNIAADLKLGPDVSEKSKQYVIDDILNTLGLAYAYDTRCQNLSGGQKKRLSIALELIDNPPIMFLDEPTTGLDSLSSSQTVMMLKTLAREGRTIICTIHQPSASLYELFDHVYVMAEGKCIFQGASSNTVPYLAEVGLQCPRYHNPADYLLEVANCEYGNYTDMLNKKVTEKSWREPEKVPKIHMDMNHVVLTEKEQNVYSVDMEFKQSPSEWKQFYILLNRSMKQMYRDWTISHLKLLLHMIVGIFLGITYLNAGSDGSKTINNIGFLIISAMYLIYTSLMPSILKFPSEIAILKKERFNNWYNLKTYYAAFLVADIPLQIIFSMAYTLFSYFISGQPMELHRFLMVQSILSMVTLIASSMGIVLGTTVNPINGTFLGAITTAFMLSVAGFLMVFTHMNKLMYTMSYFSYISYALEGLVQAVYGYDRPPIPCPEEVEYCHYRFPHVILKEFGMEKQNYWIDIIYLMTTFVALRIIAFCTLRRKLSPN